MKKPYVFYYQYSVTDESTIRGDADSDGEVTSLDATWIQRHLAGMASPLDKPTNDELYARR